jgi:DNA-binding NarL/FixJ family response regulator
MTIRALLITDNRLFREGLVRALNEDNSVEVIDTVSNQTTCIEDIAARQPDVVLVDMAMHGAFSTLRQVRQSASTVKTISLTVAARDDEVIKCIEAGVAGYLTRDGSFTELVASVRAAMNGELLCSARVTGSIVRRLANLSAEREAPTPVEYLTPRESHILELVGKGLSNKLIAREAGIEVATVKNHVHNILEKLGVRCRGEAAATLRRWRSNGNSTTATPFDCSIAEIQRESPKPVP